MFVHESWTRSKKIEKKKIMVIRTEESCVPEREEKRERDRWRERGRNRMTGKGCKYCLLKR